ncbi:MAG: ATP synthase F0 subunit B, partial [Verrucomicrobiota bacterium]
EAEKSRTEILKKANEDASRMIEEAKASAETAGAKKVQEAVSQAETIIKKAEDAAARDREQMMNELRSEMGRLVVETTEKVVGSVLTEKDQKRLQEEAAQTIS